MSNCVFDIFKNYLITNKSEQISQSQMGWIEARKKLLIFSKTTLLKINLNKSHNPRWVGLRRGKNVRLVVLDFSLWVAENMVENLVAENRLNSWSGTSGGAIEMCESES